MRYRHLILDRDGVLNYEAPPPGFVMRPEDFRGAGCACRKPEPGLIREAIVGTA